MQGVERLLELVTNPQLAVRSLMDVQGLEESLVQLAALLVVAALVERLRVFEELQARLDDLCCDAEILVGVLQPGGETVPLPGNLPQPGLDLALWQCAVGGQVDEVGLLGVELTKLFGELGMEELGRALLLVQHGSQVGTHRARELGREPDSRVVGLDSFLDPPERDVGQLAGVAVAAGAEEVPVCVAVPVGGLAQDHAAAFAVTTQAGAAEQRAFQLVVVDTP
ncbi:hypothetical protein [Streptomyces shenzhenensis]|uniref:hypothetical protein n=1 Tax=Streptomyces shenzhenensis TaxID=943815 RepID=UPI001F1BCB36|nr:hypothetical protein [Streptomyces shenzhenensis]